MELIEKIEALPGIINGEGKRVLLEDVVAIVKHHFASEQEKHDKSNFKKVTRLNECNDVLRKSLSKKEYRGYCKGNAIKHVFMDGYDGYDIGEAEGYLEYIKGHYVDMDTVSKRIELLNEYSKMYAHVNRGAHHGLH